MCVVTGMVTLLKLVVAMALLEKGRDLDRSKLLAMSG